MLKITNLKEHHIDDVVAILYPIVRYADLKKSLKLHMKKGVARIGIDDATGAICAIGCFVISAQNRCSLSHYWVHPKLRGKVDSLLFYAHIFGLIPKGYDVLIHSKEIATFERYVEKTIHKDVYRFKGLRDIHALQEKVASWVKS